jgi:hypothetical protein
VGLPPVHRPARLDAILLFLLALPIAGFVDHVVLDRSCSRFARILRFRFVRAALRGSAHMLQERDALLAAMMKARKEV